MDGDPIAGAGVVRVVLAGIVVDPSIALFVKHASAAWGIIVPYQPVNGERQ